MFLVRRFEPYFELPSKAEDADSPVGPLQHHVAEPDFVEWESIDWSALSLGLDTPNECQIHGLGSCGNGSRGSPTRGSNTNAYDMGYGYGFCVRALLLLMFRDIPHCFKVPARTLLRNC